MQKKQLLSKLPKVDELLNTERIINLTDNHPRIIVLDSIRNKIDALRSKILKSSESEINNINIDNEELINDILMEVENKSLMRLRKVINATGVILHTNLGRSLISESAIQSIIDVACNYSNLEFNLNNGERGSRYSHVEEIICRLTGAEAALVVNNNASAVLLVLNTLAKNKEVIVSRGQLVEIGGSFRVPDVMIQSGAKLIEVGTTNKTHSYDYENNINDDTAAILKVHTSNYKILGFTKETDIKNLSDIGKKYNIPVIEDIGSGTLIDFSKYGITKEPTVKESIDKGADIVTFSGDKLLGGPQAGIIAGKREFIDKMKKNQLTRAIRVDKMTLVALEATLRLYLDEERAIKEIPALNMITMSMDEIKGKAELLYSKIIENKIDMEILIIDGYSQVGGGSMPLEELPTKLLSLTSLNVSAARLEELLRAYATPIITRINDDKVLMDVRTIKIKDFDIIIDALKALEGGQ